MNYSSAGPERFHEIVHTYGGYVYTIAYRMLGNAADAEDAAQETFMKAYRRFADYNEAYGLKNWLCTIALNTARDIYRKKRRSSTVQSEAEVALVADSHEETALVQSRLDIATMLADLNIRYRSVIILFYMEQYSIKEISTMLKKSETVIKVWLYRARKLLTEKYGDNAL